MPGLPDARAATLLLTALLLAAGPAQAQFYDSPDTVLVTPDGALIHDIPEVGSVRVVYDNFGRRLLLNSWNEVVGIEIPATEYTGGPAARGNDRLNNPDGFPSAPIDRNQSGRSLASAQPDAQIERRDINPTTGTIPERERTTPGATAPRIDTLPLASGTGSKLTKAQVTALQVFLDRNGISPGVIDGKMGSNVEKALAAYTEATGETLDPADADLIVGRLSAGEGLAFTSYEITSEDAAGPFIASVPADYSEKAKLERMAFTSTAEMLAERFHMDQAYLQELNPDADFTRPGSIIKIVAIGSKRKGAVTRIIADKTWKQVRAYDVNGALVAAYPATIGSAGTPSPTGEVRIERVALNPGYTYNPKVNFTQGTNDKVLEVPPGPNGPVGSVWIALSKPTYGIHGTPEPSKIGKTESYGCVRLTNWDAEELAGMVKAGVTVTFVE